MKARDNKHLGQLLRSRRREKGLSQADLSRHSGLRQPTISNIEMGVNATTESLFKLLAALDCEMDLSLIDRKSNIFNFEE